MSTPSLSPKLLVLVSLGTFIEWAEYLYYGYLAVFLSSIFFPNDNPNAAIIITFAIMAGGYLMRPLGAILFGYIGDKKGRTQALFGSMLFMAISTTAIGLLPTYESIGLWAPIGLLLARLIQGLALGGEFNGACVYLIESSPKRPHVSSSYVVLASVLGMIVGALCAGIVQKPNMPEWAFRVPFLIGGVSALIGMYLRSAQKQSLSTQRSPLATLFIEHKLALFKVAIAGAFVGVLVYVGNVYYVTYLIKISGIDKVTATYLAMYGEIIVLFGIPLCARYCDMDLNRTEPFLRLALVLTALLSPFIFYLSYSTIQEPPALSHLLLAQSIFGVLDALVSSVIMVWAFNQFPSHVRYTGVSLGWGLGVALLGGFAPMLATLMQTSVHAVWGPGLLIMGLSLCLLIVTHLKIQSKAS